MRVLRNACHGCYETICSVQHFIDFSTGYKKQSTVFNNYCFQQLLFSTITIQQLLFSHTFILLPRCHFYLVCVKRKSAYQIPMGKKFRFDFSVGWNQKKLNYFPLLLDVRYALIGTYRPSEVI